VAGCRQGAAGGHGADDTCGASKDSVSALSIGLRMAGSLVSQGRQALGFT